MNEMNKVFRPLLQLRKNCDTIQSVEIVDNLQHTVNFIICCSTGGTDGTIKL